MIYDIAVGAFIALAAYDFISHAAEYIYNRSMDASRRRKLEAIMDEWWDTEYLFGESKPKVKAKPIKKTAVKKKP